MTSPTKNDITGDKLQTKPTTQQYRDGWDAIFGKAEKLMKKPIWNPCQGHACESDLEESKNERTPKES